MQLRVFGDLTGTNSSQELLAFCIGEMLRSLGLRATVLNEPRRVCLKIASVCEELEEDPEGRLCMVEGDSGLAWEAIMPA